jgi:hypothetical protein
MHASQIALGRAVKHHNRLIGSLMRIPKLIRRPGFVAIEFGDINHKASHRNDGIYDVFS